LRWAVTGVKMDCAVIKAGAAKFLASNLGICSKIVVEVL
jgi:hypothetical protein